MGIKCLDGEYPFYTGELSIAAKLADVRAIFEATTCLGKARALTKLTLVQLRKLFPKTNTVDRWRHVNNLLRIAKRLHLQAHDGTHDQCSQCLVIRSVHDQPFNTLVRVAKFDTTEAQLREAMGRTLFA